MNARSLLTIACAVLVLGSLAMGQGKRRGGQAAAPAATPVPVKETGFAAFRLVRMKNIFDPDRRPMPVEGAPPPKTTATASGGPAKTYLVLTGTMVTEGRRLAFFSGSQSSYNKVVSAHEKVADCEVSAISTAFVELKRGEENIVLPVGKQVTLGEQATVADAPVQSSSLATPLPSGAPPSVGAARTMEVGAPPDRAEVIRRMMERRQKEAR